MEIKTKLTALICGLIVIGSGQSVMAQANQYQKTQEQNELLQSVEQSADSQIDEVSGVYQTVQQRTPNRLPARLHVRPLNYSQPGYQGQKKIIQGDPRNPNAPTTHGYPYLNAPLYPTPEPHVLYQTGASIITNQAFAPHEMLYPHKYHGIYGPFYYKVNGHWKVLPWGVWSSENWTLQGTHVHVNYRSKRKFLSGFHPPSIR